MDCPDIEWYATAEMFDSEVDLEVSLHVSYWTIALFPH